MGVGISLTLLESASVLRTDYPGIELHLTEDVTGLAVTLSPAESFSCALTEQATITVVLSASDLLSPSATETATAPEIAFVATTDSIAIQGSDATPTLNEITVFLVVTDTCAVRASDLHGSSVLGTSATDLVAVGSTTPGFGEDVDIFAFVPQQFVSVSVVDTCVVQVITLPFNLQQKSMSDSCELHLVEPENQSLGWTLADTLLAAGTESTPTIVLTAPQVDLTVADMVALPLSEATLDIGALGVVAADACAVQSDDVQGSLLAGQPAEDAAVVSAAEAASPAISQAALDSLRLVATEGVAWQQAFPVTDTVVAGATDAAPALFITFAFNVTESVVIGADDGVPTFQSPQPILASDQVAIPATESPLLDATLQLADTCGLPVADAASLILRLLAVTDDLGLPAAEAVTLFSDFIALATTDAAAVQAADAVFFLQEFLTQLTTTETLGVTVDEQPQIESTHTAEDALTVAAAEATNLLFLQLASDTAAYQIDSEDANIVNPFIVVSFINVGDGLSVALAEAVDGAQPTLLGFFASDVAALPLSEMALIENLDLPVVVDFMIETSYRQTNTPQSFQTVSSNFW